MSGTGSTSPSTGSRVVGCLEVARVLDLDGLALARSRRRPRGRWPAPACRRSRPRTPGSTAGPTPTTATPVTWRLATATATSTASESISATSEAVPSSSTDSALRPAPHRRASRRARHEDERCGPRREHAAAPRSVPPAPRRRSVSTRRRYRARRLDRGPGRGPLPSGHGRRHASRTAVRRRRCAWRVSRSTVRTVATRCRGRSSASCASASAPRQARRRGPGRRAHRRGHAGVLRRRRPRGHGDGRRVHRAARGPRASWPTCSATSTASASRPSPGSRATHWPVGSAWRWPATS